MTKFRTDKGYWDKSAPKPPRAPGAHAGAARAAVRLVSTNHIVVHGPSTSSAPFATCAPSLGRRVRGARSGSARSRAS